MKLTNEQKNEIRELLQNYVGRYPSQNKAANSLIGISAGTVSTILNGRYLNRRHLPKRANDENVGN